MLGFNSHQASEASEAAFRSINLISSRVRSSGDQLCVGIDRRPSPEWRQEHTPDGQMYEW